MVKLHFILDVIIKIVLIIKNMILENGGDEMTQYLKEQERNKLRDKYSRFQKKEIERSTEAMQQSIKQVSCRRLRHCGNAETKYCLTGCKYNTAMPGTQDYYKEKIPGLKFL